MVKKSTWLTEIYTNKVCRVSYSNRSSSSSTATTNNGRKKPLCHWIIKYCLETAIWMMLLSFPRSLVNATDSSKAEKNLEKWPTIWFFFSHLYWWEAWVVWWHRHYIIPNLNSVLSTMKEIRNCQQKIESTETTVPSTFVMFDRLCGKIGQSEISQQLHTHTQHVCHIICDRIHSFSNWSLQINLYQSLHKVKM